MDNFGKALYIGAGALLFIIALTASVILYGSVLESAEGLIEISDFGSRAESGSSSYRTEDRTITKAEVLMSVIKINSLNANEIVVVLPSRTTSFVSYGDDYNILINGRAEPELISIHNFSNEILDGNYTSSYLDGVLTYTLIEEG